MTLVEILVVCLIVAILIAIAMPNFLAQKSDAQDAAAKTGARNARIAMETFYTEHQDYTASEADLIAIEPALKESPALSVSGTKETFRVSVQSIAGAKGGGVYTVTRAADGRVTRSCSNPGYGGCKSAPDPDGNLW